MMKRILIAGSSGQVGQALIAEAHKRGMQCHVLTRSIQTDNSPSTSYFKWNPALNEIDADCFDGVEVIVNLAGKSIDIPWTRKNKKELVSSRISSVKCLGEALNKFPNKVRTVINASAIGIYAAGDQKVNEEGRHSKLFLGELAKAWEESTSDYPASVRVVRIRIGLVLGARAKLFEKIKPSAKWGVCTVFGSGSQWVSWIHEVDLARAIVHLGSQSQPKPVYNLVATNPVSATSFYNQVHSVYRKPWMSLRIPAFFLKLIFGDKSELFLSSQNISSDLLSQEFDFKYPNLEDAIQEIALSMKSESTSLS